MKITPKNVNDRLLFIASNSELRIVNKRIEIFEKMESFTQADLDELTNDEMRLFLTFNIMEDKKENFPEELSADWVFQAAKKHAEALKIDITDYPLFLMCYKYQSIGLIVLVLLYIKHLKEKKKLETIDMSEFSKFVFPFGYIPNSKIVEYYDELKNLRSDNAEN